QRKQGVRLRFREGPAEFLFHAVHLVEEIAAIYVQPPAAQLPIRAQQKEKTKRPVLVFVQGALGHQTNIGHILFDLAAVGSPAVFTLGELERHRTRVLPDLDALPVAVETSANPRPTDALARGLLELPDRPYASPLAADAGHSRHSDSVRSIPLISFRELLWNTRSRDALH